MTGINYRLNRTGNRIIVEYSAYDKDRQALISGLWEGRVLSIEKPAHWEDWASEDRDDFIRNFESVFGYNHEYRIIKNGHIVR